MERSGQGLMAHHTESHPSEEALEEYALGLLPEEQVAELEEHLLLCAVCQDRLRQADDFIAAMREAARRWQQSPPPRWRLAWGTLQRWFEVPAMPWAAAAAAVLVLVLLLPRLLEPRGRSTEPLTVLLRATRALEPGAFAQAPAHRPLQLAWDPAGLGPEECCRVEVVDARGRTLVEIRVRQQQEGARAIVGGLQPGTYWVRLYGLQPGDALLREFGLKVR
ncbi:MAG: hypothetical protein RMI94_08940 [Bryobacterales bacterium]|nr:hypothetical protein [Bryobacteraceae bacterium]MDW8130663.1 hypothetical protein [Bryobacterales bacterium]